MKKQKILALAFSGLIGCFIIFPALAADKLPGGWFKAGTKPQDYEVNVDRKNIFKEKQSLSITGKSGDTEGFGTLMQKIKAGKFAGKRVRLSGYLKSKDISGWGGLWMRVDGEGEKSLAFDNMQDRGVSGTSDWKKYDIVLDVPAKSQYIAFGILTSGKGTLWINNLTFDTVGKNVKTTNMYSEESDEPVNLNFEN
jgi:hypothetical protein